MFRTIEQLLFAITAVALAVGCKEDDPEPAFVAGNVIVGFKKEVTFRQALEFAAFNADSIATISGFFYYSNLPNDSLDFINRVLDEEGIEYASAFIHAIENRIVIIKNYHNDDDKSTIGKWLSITEDPILQFEDMQTFKSMMFYIQPGTEKKWMREFIEHPYVRYAELNYYLP
jgi:hypothetical protein